MEAQFDIEVFKTQFLLFLKAARISSCDVFKNDIRAANTVRDLKDRFIEYGDEIADKLNADYNPFTRDMKEEMQDEIDALESELAEFEEFMPVDKRNLFLKLKLRLFLERQDNFTLDELERLLTTNSQKVA